MALNTIYPKPQLQRKLQDHNPMYKTTPVEQNVKIEKIYKQMDIARSLVLCVCFVDLVCPLIFCPFSSGRCIVGPSVYSF
jgi:hypothetical protein